MRMRVISLLLFNVLYCSQEPQQKKRFLQAASIHRHLKNKETVVEIFSQDHSLGEFIGADVKKVPLLRSLLQKPTQWERLDDDVDECEKETIYLQNSFTRSEIQAIISLMRSNPETFPSVKNEEPPFAEKINGTLAHLFKNFIYFVLLYEDDEKIRKINNKFIDYFIQDSVLLKQMMSEVPGFKKACYHYYKDTPDLNRFVYIPDYEALIAAVEVKFPHWRFNTVPQHLFSFLPYLTKVNFYHSQIETLPPHVFDMLENVEFIDLSESKLSSLPVGIFDKCIRLKKLYLNQSKLLHNSKFKGLPFGVFNKLSCLELLDLGCNRLEELPSGIFDGLKNLETLSLLMNSLKELPPGIFNGLESLKKLNISYNKLKLLPAGIFDKTRKMEDLVLSFNELEDTTFFYRLFFPFARHRAFPDKVFCNLKSLKFLNVSGNKLRIMHQHLIHLESLKVLRIYKNKFSKDELSWMKLVIPLGKSVYFEIE